MITMTTTTTTSPSAATLTLMMLRVVAIMTYGTLVRAAVAAGATATASSPSSVAKGAGLGRRHLGSSRSPIGAFVGSSAMSTTKVVVVGGGLQPAVPGTSFGFAAAGGPPLLRSTTTTTLFSSSSSSSETTSTSTQTREDDDQDRTCPILYPTTFDPDEYTLHHPMSCPVDSHLTGVLPSYCIRPGRRVVSFGDVHGDINALIAFLVTAKVMRPPNGVDDALSNPTWIGGDTIVVQCGDLLDRGGNELGCLRLLSKLSLRATEEGGAIHLLYGNHESMNACGLFQYADPEGNAEFDLVVGNDLDRKHEGDKWRIQYAGNQAGRWAAFEPGGLLGENLLARMKVCMVVGRTVFVHAGLTADHLREYYYYDEDEGGEEKTGPSAAANAIEEMNRAAREWMMNVQHDECNLEGEYTSTEHLLDSANSRAKGISDSMPSCLGGGIGSPSPVWMRDYSRPPDLPPANPSKAQRMIDDALSELGPELDVRRMVVGHTPQSRINSALKGRAWRVDVGASRGVAGGTPEVLEIVHTGDDEGGEDEVHVLTMDGRRIPGRERQAVEDVLL